MKAVSLFLTVLFLVCTVWSQNTEYLTKSEFQQEKKKVSDNIAGAKKQVAEARKAITDLKTKNDSLKYLLMTTGARLEQSTDSLDKTSAKLNALQDQVDRQKGVSKTVFIVFVAVILVLLIVLFVLILMFRTSILRMLKSHEEENMKANAKTLADLQKKEDAIRENATSIHTMADEMKEKISGVSSRLDQSLARMDQQFKENLQGLEARIGTVISDEIGIREEIQKVFRNSEQSVAAVKTANETEHKDLSTKIAETGKEIKDSVQKTRAELDALKSQIAKASHHSN